MLDCALCQLAATPIDERETKTFFSGYLFKCWAHLGRLEVVRDANLDGAPDRLMCFLTEHTHMRERQHAIVAGDGNTRAKSMMAMILECIANAEFGVGNWTFEATMRSCPEHGWHCHARRKT